MRVAIAVCLMITGVTCREIQPLSISQPVLGYQLNGTVTTGGGAPVESVEVILFYDLDPFSSSPIDTQSVVVTNPNQIVDIRVYTPRYEQVRRLLTGSLPVGIVPRYNWDGLGDDGKPVPSGKYLVRYAVDAVIVKYSTVVISGHVTTLTDSQGHFTLSSARLPVGEIYDYYSPDNMYIGTAKIRSDVSIELRKPPSSPTSPRVITLQQDQITVGSFTLDSQ